MITAAQLRAARGLLDWTRQDLAKAAGVSTETIKNIEHGTFRPQETTTSAIIKAFTSRDVQFTDDEGVRMRRDSVKRFEGVDGFKKFLDDVYAVAQRDDSHEGGAEPIYISNVDDRLFQKTLGDFFNFHIERMNKISGLKMRILIQDKPHSLTQYEKKTGSYREYKKFPFSVMGDAPFYVYGNNLAILVFEGENAPNIVVISSGLVAKAYREQFNLLWQTALPIGKESAQS